jgi:vanillate/4-hydroxybenzoate decarboxylase subunit D
MLMLPFCSHFSFAKLAAIIHSARKRQYTRIIMHNFPRPTTATVSVDKENVSGTCAECNSTMLARYRVLSEGGWWNVVKCQHCLASVQREPGPLFGAYQPLTTLLELN